MKVEGTAALRTIDAATDARANRGSAMTSTPMPPISRRSSRNSICTTPSTSPTRPAPVGWRRDATDAEDGPKPGWPADRSLQQYARRRDGGSIAVHQGLKRAVLWGQSTERDGLASSLGCVLAPRHAGRNPGDPRVHQGVLRERSYRRSEEDRCADADPARRRRSDRTDRRIRDGLGDAREGFDLNGVSGFLQRSE